jgi:Ca2+-binding RTX toxin-like protein
MKKIAQDGGLSFTNADVRQALTAFAMQMYHDDPKNNATNVSKKLFDNIGVSGGIHFDRSDVTATLSNAKGYSNYFQQYLSTLPGNKNGIITRELPDLLDWYIQAGASPMTASAANKTAFMLGWNGADNLTGGTASDLLYGGAGVDNLTGGSGNDTLIGGTGNDFLYGGAGHDVYQYTMGDGNDTIIDEDRDGEIKLYDTDGNPIALGDFYRASGQSEWINSKNSNITITGNILHLPDGSTINLGTDIKSGDLGINLIGLPADQVKLPLNITNTIVGERGQVCR